MSQSKIDVKDKHVKVFLLAFYERIMSAKKLLATDTDTNTYFASDDFVFADKNNYKSTRLLKWFSLHIIDVHL